MISIPAKLKRLLSNLKQSLQFKIPKEFFEETGLNLEIKLNRI